MLTPYDRNFLLAMAVTVDMPVVECAHLRMTSGDDGDLSCDICGLDLDWREVLRDVTGRLQQAVADAGQAEIDGRTALAKSAAENALLIEQLRERRRCARLLFAVSTVLVMLCIGLLGAVLRG